MLDDLRPLAVFAKTVEAGSFRAAARQLGLSPSVVSHHVAQLESRLGLALIYRSTRRLSLTVDGTQLYQHAHAMLAAAEAGLNAMNDRAVEPVGELSISLPAFLASGPLMPQLTAFIERHPRVRLHMDFSDEKQDLIAQGIDLAIRIGALQDSALKAVRLLDLPRTLVAAPALLQGRAPQTPAELTRLDWIGIRMRPGPRRFRHEDGQEVEIEIEPRVEVNSIEASRQLSIAGLGLCSPPTFLVADDLAAGRLVQVLPEWRVPTLGIYAVWPPNAGRDGLSRRLVAALQDGR